jgi:hypothetical protein
MKIGIATVNKVQLPFGNCAQYIKHPSQKEKAKVISNLGFLFSVFDIRSEPLRRNRL